MSCSVKSLNPLIFDSPTRVECPAPKLKDEQVTYRDVPCSRPPFGVNASIAQGVAGSKRRPARGRLGAGHGLTPVPLGGSWSQRAHLHLRQAGVVRATALPRLGVQY